MRNHVVLTQLTDCSSFGLEGLPLPREEDYQKALEDIVKDALGRKAEKVERKLKRDGLCSILKGTKTGKKRFSSSNFVEAIKKATREAFFECDRLWGLEISDPMWEFRFRRILYQRQDFYLAWPLQTQGLRVLVCVEAHGEDHFKVCVTAVPFRDEASSDEEETTSPATSSFDPSDEDDTLSSQFLESPDGNDSASSPESSDGNDSASSTEPSDEDFIEVERAPVWGVSLDCKVLVADSLQREAAVVVAKSLADRGEEGLSHLEYPKKLKVIIREFLDKVEKPEDGMKQVDAI